MPSFIVQSAEFVKPLPPKEGRKPMFVHRLLLLQEGASPNGSPQQQTIPCEWLTTNEQPPAPGTQLEGDIQPSDNPAFLPKFKKAQQFGGGGPRKTDPSDAARMLRCHSQSAAIELAGLLLQTEKVKPEDFGWEYFIGLVDALDRDVKKAAQGV